jgi:hypothetical protein
MSKRRQQNNKKHEEICVQIVFFSSSLIRIESSQVLNPQSCSALPQVGNMGGGPSRWGVVWFTESLTMDHSG